MTEPAPSHFKGFSSPYYTQVPDILFDELLSELSGAELKVLLYIIRRTFGFKKESDNISLSQMVRGITARDGTVLDRGTGLNKDTVIKAVRSLEERGMLRRVRRASSEQGDEATSYELVMEVEEGGVGKSDTGGCRKNGHGGVGKSDTQYTVKQYTDFEYSNNSNVKILEKEEEKKGSATLSIQSHNPSLYALQKPPEASHDVQEEMTTLESTGETPSFHGAFHAPRKGFAAIGDTLATRRTAPRLDDAQETISTFIKDIAVELNDKAPRKSSVSRACNLFTRANVSIESFMGSLFEARSITKERAREGRIRAGRSSMAYFFSVLSERLGLDGERASRVDV